MEGEKGLIMGLSRSERGCGCEVGGTENSIMNTTRFKEGKTCE